MDFITEQYATVIAMVALTGTTTAAAQLRAQASGESSQVQAANLGISERSRTIDRRIDEGENDLGYGRHMANSGGSMPYVPNVGRGRMDLQPLTLRLARRLNAQTPPEQEPPYPRSSVILDVAWDFSSHRRAAPGSDLWPVTWADDGHLYTAWGDGGGFGGTNSRGRVSLGVARIEGAADSWKGVNVWGGYRPASQQKPIAGKSNGGFVCIEGTLYLFVTEQGKWKRAKLWTSADHGMTWDDRGWIFAEPDGAFAAPGIIQVGKDYRGARDEFVYGYCESVRGVVQRHIDLFRVPKDRLAKRQSYEFFAGTDARGQPQWTSDIHRRRPVFSDPNGITWGVNACYCAALKRYLMTVRRNETGAWGIFDAPEPWGPWTTVAYYDHWMQGTGRQITYLFPTKWIDDDGKTLWMVFSADDSFNVLRCKLETAPG